MLTKTYRNHPDSDPGETRESSRSRAACRTQAHRMVADNLCRRLQELMSDPKVYTDPAVSRKSVATALGTNEKYLRETILEHFGATFFGYINTLRLEHARELLLDAQELYTIEVVALMCGIGSRSTFHRLFRDRFGTTPDEFRRKAGY